MSDLSSFVVFFAAIFSVLIGLAALYDESKRPEEQRNALMVNYLPIYFLGYAVVALCRGGVQEALLTVISGWFAVFLHIAFYYALLLPLLPLLRKRLSAKACACLWTIPACLYVYLQGNFSWVRAPRIILRWPGYGIRTVVVIWLAGFVGVLVWHTAAHLVYRRQLLRDAREESDPEILALWQEMQKDHTIEKANVRLVRSPEAGTPLTIGLSRRTMRVVLPERAYTPAELRLIFRHELIHIRRGDCWTKLYLLFYAAMCWFLPLMWIAMRRSADDLELSCDEAVLWEADDAARRQYAELILTSAGDQRGYTTCLSASAAALRYRLKHMMQPRKRSGGALTIALVTFVLFLTVGNVGLAYGGAFAKEVIFDGEAAFADYPILYASVHGSSHEWVKGECPCQRELAEYLDSLKLYEMTGGGIGQDDDPVLRLEFSREGRSSSIWVRLCDHTLEVNWYERTSDRPPYSSRLVEKKYYMEQEIDWAYLTELIQE